MELIRREHWEFYLVYEKNSRAFIFIILPGPISAALLSFCFSLPPNNNLQSEGS